MAMTFGRGVDSGIVQRTFSIALVVMFGGLITNPFVTLKEPMSGVAPTKESKCQKAAAVDPLLISLPMVNTTKSTALPKSVAFSQARVTSSVTNASPWTS